MPAEKLTFHINCVEVIALAFPNGRTTVSQITNKPQVMYTLTDGRVTYADMCLVEEINRLGVRANEPFEVVKRSQNSYEVRRVRAAGPQTQEANQKFATPAGTPNYITVPRDTEHSQDSAEYSPRALSLMSALKDAIDAAHEATRYASRLGVVGDWSSEDVRAMALTLFIDSARGAR